MSKKPEEYIISTPDRGGGGEDYGSTSRNQNDIALYDQTIKGEDGKLKIVNASHFSRQDGGNFAAMAVCVLVTYLSIGVGYGMGVRGWDLIESLYFIVVTGSTIGYGDMNFSNCTGTTSFGDEIGDVLAAVDDPLGNGGFQSCHDGEKVLGSIFAILGVIFIGCAGGVVVERMFNKQGSKNSSHSLEEQFGSRRRTLQEDLDSVWQKARLSLISMVGILVVGTAGMNFIEDMTIVDSFYWASITMTTVGYGDVTPKSDAGRAFCIVFILASMYFVAHALMVLATLPLEISRIEHAHRTLHQFGSDLDQEELTTLLSDPLLYDICKSRNKQCVTRGEYILWSLVQAELVKRHWVHKAGHAFDMLDVDGSGELDQDDINVFLANKPAAPGASAEPVLANDAQLPGPH